MFTVEIAGIPVGIESRYGSTREIYREYLSRRRPWVTVSAMEEEMAAERQQTPEENEQLCLYRKIALLMMNYNAFLMHAAVINIDGQGVMFTAESGTGKTTRVLLWKKAFGKRMRIVNGDKPILRFIHDGLFACGTPWRGKEHMGENNSVPMKAVCFLERGGRGIHPAAGREGDLEEALQTGAGARQSEAHGHLHEPDGTFYEGSAVLPVHLQHVQGRTGKTLGTDSRGKDSAVPCLRSYGKGGMRMIRARDGFVMQKLMDEYMIIATGENADHFRKIIQTNETGAFYWGMIEKGTSLDKLVSASMARYVDLDEPTARQDIGEFLESISPAIETIQ